LQSDVSHGVSVADKVAFAGEERAEKLAQFLCRAEVERNVGTADAFFGELPNNSRNGLLTGQQRL
jgi:hypothetical protein